MRVAITGATGFIGAGLRHALADAGIDYVVVTRNRDKAKEHCPKAAGVIEWDPPASGPEPEAFNGLDGIFHIAGSTIAQRWTSKTKQTIRDSRVASTRLLVESIRKCSLPPKTLISASAIGYYGPSDDTPLNESAPAGSDFLARLCRDWEAESARARESGIRVVNPRTGIVLGRGGGALAQMLTPFRMGVGGPIGNGRQWMSWIHLTDVVGIMLQALTDEGLSGPVNTTAPTPVTNAEFAKTLGRVLRRPAVLPTPVFALKIIFGEFADVLATGQRVIPEKAVDAGYGFRYPALEQALADAV